MYVIGLEYNVVSLANGRDGAASHINAKVGVLSNSELVIVGQLVQPVAVDPTLLHAQEVTDGAHQGLGPFTVGEPAAQPIAEIGEALVACSSFEGIDQDALSGHEVKGTFGIEQQDEDGLLGRVERKIHRFC